MVLQVPDADYGPVEQISLGGLTVRAGHGAVLTWLERAFHVCDVLGRGRELTSDTRSALLSLVRDPEARVRAAAAAALSSSGDRAAAVADAFVLLLDEDDHRVSALWHWTWRNRPDQP